MQLHVLGADDKPNLAPRTVWGVGGPTLSVVVPTFNEAANVNKLIANLEAALAGIFWEVIFVDDNSADGTAAIAKSVAARDPRVRCLHRIGRRGLAGACIEGILSSSAPYVAVIDGDLQHDENCLPAMLQSAASGKSDLVVGSRYAEGGGIGTFSRIRRSLSRLAVHCMQVISGVALTDPVSGFFLMRRVAFDAVAPKLSSAGFKILSDIVISSGSTLRISEQPYIFRSRNAGDSKFDSQIGLEFLGLLLSKLTRNFFEPRFLPFAFVGGVGLIVHMFALRLAFYSFGNKFAVAQAIATLAAMTSNFFLNNATTYRDKRLRGHQILPGLLRFYLVGSAGAVANIGLASWIYAQEPVWWLSGAAGALMGALWNYTMSSRWVWQAR